MLSSLFDLGKDPHLSRKLALRSTVLFCIWYLTICSLSLLYVYFFLLAILFSITFLFLCVYPFLFYLIWYHTLLYLVLLIIFSLLACHSISLSNPCFVSLLLYVTLFCVLSSEYFLLAYCVSFLLKSLLVLVLIVFLVLLLFWITIFFPYPFAYILLLALVVFLLFLVLQIWYPIVYFSFFYHYYFLTMFVLFYWSIMRIFTTLLFLFLLSLLDTIFIHGTYCSHLQYHTKMSPHSCTSHYSLLVFYQIFFSFLLTCSFWWRIFTKIYLSLSIFIWYFTHGLFCFLLILCIPTFYGYSTRSCKYFFNLVLIWSNHRTYFFIYSF